MKKNRLLAHGALLLSGLFSLPGLCATLSPRIDQLGHTAWRTTENDFPGTLGSMAQTTDGFLWIGTSTGLMRYDGQTFSLFPIPGLQDADIETLATTQDGSLWIATRNKVVRWHGGEAQTFNGNTAAISLLADGASGIWIQRQDKLERCKAETMQCAVFPTPVKADEHTKSIIVSDGGKGFWQIVGPHFYHWDGNKGAMFDMPTNGLPDRWIDINTAHVAPDGTLWFGLQSMKDIKGVYTLKDGVFHQFLAALPGSPTRLEVYDGTVDHDGNFWLATVGLGLIRIHGSQIEHYDKTNGLSNDRVCSVFVDREGSLWVTSMGGIDKFRDMPIRSWPTSQREAYSVGILPDGSLVSGPIPENLLRPNDPESAAKFQKSDPSEIYTLLVDHAGRVIFSRLRGVYISDGKTIRTLLEWDDPTRQRVLSLSESPDHTLWAQMGSPFPDGSRIYEFRDDKVVQIIPRTPDLRGNVLLADNDGFWFSNHNGELGHYDHGAPHVWRRPGSSRMDIDNAHLLQDGAVLAVENDGLLLFEHGVYRALGIANGLPCANLHAVVINPAGDVWATSPCGMLHILAADFNTWRKKPTLHIPVEQFSTSDGSDVTVHGSTNSTLLVAPDGKIWMSGASGLAMIDPASLYPHSVPAPSAIEEIVADRRSISSLASVSLAPRTHEIEIHYAGLSFVRPERVHYQIRLDGQDRAWVDNSTRHSAFYSNLSPGRYTFHVRAMNETGVWGPEQTLTFGEQPAWNQTLWFRVCSILTLCLLGITLYIWRMKVVERRTSLRMKERMLERARLARDLHDTLLQTVQGSRMIVDNSRELDDSIAMRNALDRASVHLEQAVKEGRTALIALRADQFEERDFEEQLRSIAEIVVGDAGLFVLITCTGATREVKSVVRSEIGAILMEAIRNTVNHAQATVAQVVAHYGDSSLQISIQDDGVGIPAQTLREGKTGHFGMHSMRERANAINAKFHVASTPGKGTIITISVPGAFAYAARSKQIQAHFSKVTRPLLSFLRPSRASSL